MLACMGEASFSFQLAYGRGTCPQRLHVKPAAWVQGLARAPPSV